MKGSSKSSSCGTYDNEFSDSSKAPLLRRLNYHIQHHFHQILAVAGATVCLFGTGTIMGFSSVTIPELMSPESSIKVDHEALSWIASLVTIGGVVGTLSGGLLSDLFGRKHTIMMSSLIFFIGWLIIGFAESVLCILVGRLLTGIASGLYSASVQVYICEIVDPSIRGVSGSIPTLMVSIGVLAMYTMGSLAHWRTLALISSGFPIFVLCYMFFLPESPVWLLNKGKVRQALNSMTWLKNDEDEAEDEIYKLQKTIEERRTSVHDAAGVKRFAKMDRRSIYSCCSRFSERAVLQPLGIGMALFFFQKFCGVSAITFYATLIFQYADNMNNYTETIIIGFVRIISNLIGIFGIKFFPRRKPLLISSALIMCFSNAILGVYFFAKDKYGNFGGSGGKSFDAIFNGNIGNGTGGVTDVVTSTMSSLLNSTAEPIESTFYTYSIECIPLICVTIFMLGSSIGFAVIPWFLVAELLPADVRSLSCSLAYGFCQLCQFTSIKTFLNMLDAFNTFGTFWIYSLIALCGALFVLVFVPETSNMDASEIEKLFEGDIDNSIEEDELTPLKKHSHGNGSGNGAAVGGGVAAVANNSRKASLLDMIQNSDNYTVVRFEGEDEEDGNHGNGVHTSRFP